MKIAIATDLFSPWTGGPATFIENFLAFLAHTPHQVDILAPSVTGKPGRETYGVATIHRMPTVPIPFGHQLRVSYRFDTVRHALLGSRPDVLQVHHPFPLSVAALRAAQGAGIPTVAVNHTIPECSFYGLRFCSVAYAPTTSLFWHHILAVLSRADAVCTPTQTAAALLRRAGFRHDLRVISNGIDTQRFHPVRDRQALRQRFGLPLDRPLVLYVGRLDPEKDLTTWLRAAALVRQHMPCHFALAGVGSERALLEGTARDLAMQADCSFLGYIEAADLPLLYASADLYCITSTVELQSISTLEAMACGIPIVAADAAALPELVMNGRNGWLAQAGDAASFAAAMRRVLDNTAYAACLGEQSRCIAETHAMSVVAARHLQLLEVTARRGRATAGTITA